MLNHLETILKEKWSSLQTEYVLIQRLPTDVADWGSVEGLEVKAAAAAAAAAAASQFKIKNRLGFEFSAIFRSTFSTSNHKNLASSMFQTSCKSYMWFNRIRKFCIVSSDIMLN